MRIPGLIMVMGLTLGAAGLAACSNDAPSAADSPAASALPPGRTAIYAAQPEGAEPFVRALYAVYVAGGPKDPPPTPGLDPIYSRQMNATIGADVRLAKGEVPDINYDPICGCQDQGVFTLDSLAVTQGGPNAADAAVVFTNAGETMHQTLKLVREGPNWKVEDIIDAEGKSLQQATIASITARGG